jgi:hypothetical protein
MNTVPDPAPLTLGGFIMGVYDACDEQRARVIVWVAINAHLVCSRASSSDCPENPWAETEDAAGATD